MPIAHWFKLAACITLPLIAGAVGSVFTVENIPTWYVALEKPALAPPNWAFGPVWTLLYLLMGVAVFLVWRRGSKSRGVGIALALFSLQLLLNTLWSIVFFELRDPGLAFIEIVALWSSVLATIVAFFHVSRIAALLLVPYILWVSFAAYLNYSIWQLNPGASEMGARAPVAAAARGT